MTSGVEDNGKHALVIESLQDAIDVATTNFFTENYGKWVFRGHSDIKYELRPSIARVPHTSRNLITFERSLFNTFKREAFQYCTYPPSSELEWLAYAQHHDLPTRLLDWSSNLLVALYFSCISNLSEDGQIIALRTTKKLSDNSESHRKPFEIDRVKKYVPRVISPRMLAQEGVFTIHPDPDIVLENQLREGWKLTKVKVSSKAKPAIRYSLWRLGVHEAKLFPSVEGLARHVKWHHTVTPLATHPSSAPK